MDCGLFFLLKTHSLLSTQKKSVQAARQLEAEARRLGATGELAIVILHLNNQKINQKKKKQKQKPKLE